MECPQCQHENPPQSTFCLDCGAPWPGCPSCGIELPAGASPASVWMIPTNEEMMIASHTLACIRP